MPWWGTSNEYPQHMFSWRIKKNVSTFKVYNLHHIYHENDYRSLRKGLLQTLSCARLLFSVSDKNQDRLSIYNKKQGIYIGKLDAWVYCPCWEHLGTISCKVIKILCLSVLNDDNKVLQQICKYKCFRLGCIRLAYSHFHLTIKNNDKNN